MIELAKLESPEVFAAFLAPLTGDATVRVRNDAEADNAYAMADRIARSIRAHARLLCRGIAENIDLASEGVVNALSSTIREGAKTDRDAGTPGAFSGKYELFPFAAPDHGIAVDLVMALRALDQDQRVLNAILEIDEPLILAQILPRVSADQGELIARRLDDLTPDRAGQISTLPEVQARIDALLGAGLATVATAHMEYEAGLSTLGRVPGRAIAKMHAALSRHAVLSEWAEIRTYVLPDGLGPMEAATASDIIRSFVGVAELRDPDGNAEIAERIFADLHARNPGVFGYENLFAAQIAQLLRGNLFRILDGEQAIRAAAALQVAESTITSSPRSGSGIAGYNANRALLLLALGRASDVLERWKALGTDSNPHLAACTSIALHRLKQTGQASATIRTAIQAFGDVPILVAAREYIYCGTLSAERPYAAVDDAFNIAGAQAAIYRFRAMNASHQANVIANATLEEFLIEHVRQAGASLTHLAPWMVNLFCVQEPELNAILQQLLRSRLSFLNWSIGDESMGGYTAAGNTGERDLVIVHDSADIAVIEAVISDGIDRTNLREHFHRLLAYSACRTFFLLVYARGVIDPLFPVLKAMARDTAPLGFAFHHIEDIELSGSLPNGFVARYGPLGQVTVAMLVLDVGQRTQRGAVGALGVGGPGSAQA